MAARGPASDFMIVGRVRKAHGVRGEVVVTPITDSPDVVFASGRRVFAGTPTGDLAEGGGELSVIDARPFKQGLLVRFAELVDRTAAEQWRDRYLLLPAAELPPPAEGELYIHELIGMRVMLHTGDDVGTVVEVYELPQGLLLEVSREGAGRGEALLIPFSDEVVQGVDVAGRVLTIDPPDGLI